MYVSICHGRQGQINGLRVVGFVETKARPAVILCDWAISQVQENQCMRCSVADGMTQLQLSRCAK